MSDITSKYTKVKTDNKELKQYHIFVQSFLVKNIILFLNIKLTCCQDYLILDVLTLIA